MERRITKQIYLYLFYLSALFCVMELQSSPVIYTNSNTDNFFRKRHTVTISFAVALLLFLMPFAELKCSSMTLAGNTGIGLALGKKWKVVMMNDNELMDKINSSARDGKKNALESDGPNIFLIIAIGAGLCGLVFTFTNFKLRPVLCMCAGILSFLMLIAIMIQFNIAMKSALAQKDKNSGLNMEMGMLMKINFTIWYYASLTAFAAAAFFSYKHHRIELQDAIDRTVDFEFQRQQNV